MFKTKEKVRKSEGIQSNRKHVFGYGIRGNIQ